MHVSNLELSRELYELSDWRTNYVLQIQDSVGEVASFVADTGQKLEAYEAPAYDLGYLLRKLPHFELRHNGQGVYWIDYESEVQDVLDIESWGHTPEDAACKLLIKLLKQGIIDKDGE